MGRRSDLLSIGVASFLALAIAARCIHANECNSLDGPSFERDIAPILVEHCVACHRSESRKGGYDLSTGKSLLAGKKEPVIVPGKPDESRFWLMLTGDESPTMPKDAPRLGDDKIELVRAWIEAGADFGKAGPDADIRTLVPPAPRPAKSKSRNRQGPITALAFSADSRFIYVGDPDGLLVYRLQPEPERTQTIDLDYGVYSLEARTDVVLVGGGNPGVSGRVDLFSVANGQLQHARTLLTSADVIHAVRWSKNGEMAAAGMERSVRLWPKDSRTPNSLEPVSDAGFDLAFTPDSKSLLVAGRDRTVKVWNLADREPSTVFAVHQDAVYAVAILPPGERAVSGSADGSLRAWTIHDAREKASNASFTKPILRLAVDAKGERVFVGGADGLVAVCSAADMKLARKFEGCTDWVFALAVSPDEKRLAAGGWDGVLRIWDPKDGALRHSIACKR